TGSRESPERFPIAGSRHARSLDRAGRATPRPLADNLRDDDENATAPEIISSRRSSRALGQHVRTRPDTVGMRDVALLNLAPETARRLGDPRLLAAFGERHVRHAVLLSDEPGRL